MKQHQESINACSNSSNIYIQTQFKDPATPQTPPPQNFVPFLIKSHRFAAQKNGLSIPPIGAYNLPSCFDRKKSPLEDRISHFMLEAERKKQQMGIFKSSLNRFSKVNSFVPGPATYNLFKITSEQRQQKYRIVQHKENAVDLMKTCPSIPHQQHKYGYAVVNGQMKNIEKSLDQLEKEKENRKIYASTLEGEQNFLQQQTYKNYHDSDYRKKLYDSTQKIVNKEPVLAEGLSSERVSKKPRYEHLYHSKGVHASQSSNTIGPGQYQINGSFNTNDKQQKFQFFSSTEVRFKDKIDTSDKGYSLIEMIKQNNRKSITEVMKERKSPFKKIASPLKINQQFQGKIVNPGPGSYDPIDDIAKKARGAAIFPYEERFKQKSPYILIDDVDQNLTLSKVAAKKLINSGTLKKNRFKPMHKTYDPVKSEQICGILSEKCEADVGKQNKLTKSGFRGKLKRDTTKMRNTDSQEISCWSRGSGKQKSHSKCYMKELKQQLAIITYSPAGISQHQIEQSSKKNSKKKSQFIQEGLS